MIRPMRLYEDIDVRGIYAACHPTWPAQPPHWYTAHPTIVLEIEREIVGYTSYSLVMQPELSQEGEIMIGYGIDIKPGHHGKGYGRLLCDERLAIARAVGAKVFVGHAATDNHAMRRLFEQDGFKVYGSSTDPDGRPIELYLGPIS